MRTKQDVHRYLTITHLDFPSCPKVKTKENVYSHFWQRNTSPLTLFVFFQAKDATIHDIVVLYNSKHFIAVSKHYDIVVYKSSKGSTENITVENQLRKMFPERVDKTSGHSFR